MPGVLPLAQVTPAALVWRFGTNTWYAPPTWYRYGFSRMTGVVPIVVYGGFGKLDAERALHPDERLVPYRVQARADGAVAGEPLLLRVLLLGAADPRVGDVAAGRPAVAVRREVEVAVNVHPAERRGLRDGPAVGAGDRVDRQVLDRAPEVLGGVALEPARVDGDVAVDPGVLRVLAEAEHRGVEADLDVQAVVGARLEREHVALEAELVRLLLPEDCVGLALDRGARHRRVEDDHVRAEAAAAGHGRSGRGGVVGVVVPPKILNSQSE
nr:hypothetical protein GCM10020092_102420 [Actinoplanes digitatis]